MRYQKKWRVTAALLAAALAASCVTGCSGGQENAETAGNTEAEGSKGGQREPGRRKAEAPSLQRLETRDSVVVVMGPTSEPEAGFDPAYGWGAGEHVHEPLIQSTLTVTTPDLKIGYDLAEDVQASEDGLTWQVKIPVSGFRSGLKPPMLFTPNNSGQRSPPTYYRGCWHVVSRGFLVYYRHCNALFTHCTFVINNRALQTEILHHSRGVAPSDFRPLRNFPTAASVGVWAVSQSQCGRSSSQTGY